MSLTSCASAPRSDGHIHSTDLIYSSVNTEKDFAYVREFLARLPSAERPSDHFISQVGRSAVIKAQLVSLKRSAAAGAKNEEVCGVLVYEQGTETPRSMIIRIMNTTDERFSGRGITRHMLYKITSIAERQGVSALYATALPQDRSSARFFEGNGFQRISSNDPQEICFMKNMRKELEEKGEKRTLREPLVPVPQKAECHSQPPAARPVRQLDVTLRQPYLSLIKSGRKTVEGRIASGMFKSVAVGSKIRFFNQGDQVICTVTGVATYASFEEMLKKEGVERCLPGSTIEAGIRIYNSLPGYSERAKQHGVVAIRLNVDERR